MKKYLAIYWISVRQSVASPGELAARVGFYAILLVVFSRLWEVVISADPTDGWSARQMVWYLALTEWVVLSIPELHLDLESDVRSGDLGYQLPRPISYYWSRFADALGRLSVRLAVMGVSGFAMAWALTGAPPESFGIAWAIPFGLCSAFLLLLSFGIIGLLATWIQDVQPVYWLWQKMVFVLGGLILPLDVYPDWLRDLAQYTPFYGMLYGTARWALEVTPSGLLWTAGNLTVWTLAFLLLARLLEHRSLCHISRTGA